MLAALGPENDLPVHRLLPRTRFVITGKPKQMLTSSVGKGNEPFISTLISQRQLLFNFNPNVVERFIQAHAEPVQVPVMVPNPQNPNDPPQQRLVPIMRRATVLTFSVPVNRDEVFSGLFRDKPDSAAIESLKRTSGKTEYYVIDQTPQNFTIPQKVGIGLLDERTAVVVEGVEEDVAAVFTDNAGTPKYDASRYNAVLNRLKHSQADSCDLFLLFSLEEMVYDPPAVEKIAGQIQIVPKSLTPLMAQHLRAFSLSLHIPAAADAPVVTIDIETRDEKGSEQLYESIQGQILNARVSLAAMNDEQKKNQPIPAEFMNLLLDSVRTERRQSRVEIVLKNSEKLLPTVSAWLHLQQTAAQQQQIFQARAEQMHRLYQCCLAYYEKYQKFPADILDKEGKPLLSWRVALLPVMGKEMEELYARFKLDEPWDSEANKAVLKTEPASIPSLFQPIAVAGTLPPKTVLHCFNSEGTPLFNRNLKKEDLKQPQTTLLCFASSPQYAAEWTKPGSPAFNIDTIKETAGNVLFGVTFTGQVCAVEILDAANPEFATRQKVLTTLIRGLPEETPPAAGNEKPPENP
jgi:hypothetical protein